MNAGCSGGAPPAPPRWLCQVAAGVDAGAGAALAVLSWFALHSRLTGEPWWAKFNLAAAAIYGSGVYWMGRSRATLAGAALLFAVYTLLGIGFAFLAGRRGPWRAALLALLWMAAWQAASERYVWPWLDSAAPDYFSRPATLPAHLAAAFLLARYPGRLRQIESLFEPQAEPSAPPPAPAETPASPAADGPLPGAESDHC